MKQRITSTSPLVSIIMPAYNCADYVSIAIESILEQDYKNLEILIADDCSTDSTKSIIDSYTDPRIKVYHNKKNEGNLFTTNRLFEKATGDLVTFQDADDWSDSRRIGEQVDLLLDNPATDICSTGYARVNQDGELLFNVRPSVSHEKIIGEITDEHHPKMCYASILTYRKIIKEVGGIYRLYFKGIGGADIDFFYRLIDKHTIQNIDKIRYFYRTAANSITNDIDLMQFYPLTVGPQLSYFLRQQRMQNGKDAIQTKDFTDLENIKESLIKKYKNDIHKLFVLVAPRWAAFQQRDNLIEVTRQYFAFHPFSLTTYINISIAYIRYLLGEERYKFLSSKLSYLKFFYKKITV